MGRRRLVSGGGSVRDDDMEEEQRGIVRVAPAVLRSIIARAALAVPGVAGIGGHLSDDMRGLLSGGAEGRGIKLRSQDDEIIIDLYVVLSADTDLLEVGRRLQGEVIRAIDALVALPVAQVNVFIQDVR